MAAIARKLLMGLSALVIMGLASCSAPKNITYFQDLQQETVSPTNPHGAIRVRPDDRLSIVVVSKDPQLASLFNLPIMSQRVGQTGVSSSNGNNDVASYVVNPLGDITFPVLGEIHIGGMTRNEVQDYIATELRQRNLVKDPTVIVDFLNRGVTVLGEVAHPGRVSFDRDQYTLVEAIGAAGDLTIQGERQNVLVMRQSPDGTKTSYRVDMTDAQNMMSSPAYYMQQDDVVYVSPNSARKRNATATGNTMLNPGFWISVASLLCSVAVLIWK